MRQVLAQARNLLDWSFVDKGILISALTLPFPASFALLSGYLHRHPAAVASFVNREYLPVIMWAGILTVAGWLVIILAGLLLRTRSPQSRAYVQVVQVYWYLGTAYMIHCFGTATSPVVLQLLTGGMVGLLLWDLRTTLPSLSLGVVLLLALVGAERIGWIPYAPLLSTPPFVEGRLSSIWLSTMILLFFGMSSLAFGLYATVILSWRDREAQLKEFNAFLRKTFGRYLSKEVVHALMSDPQAVDLGGQRRNVSILMADIRGFTQLSERLTPEQVVSLLNRYLQVMMQVCDRHRGTVNDIIGDALMVTFGAPLELADHAEAAAACAIGMQNAVATINQASAAEGLPTIEIGIGLNTAEVIVGSIGSEARSKFGVVGSGVNMTSRIESYAVGGQVLVSQSVLDEAGESLRVDQASRVFPKGAEGAFSIYAIGGVAGRYHVMLDRKPASLQIPPRKLVLKYSVVSGKQVGAQVGSIEVSRLSTTAVELAARQPLESHAQLRLQLADVSPRLARLSFYGNVVTAGDGEDLSTQVRFTSLPPEIAAYFEGLLSPRNSDGERGGAPPFEA